MRTARTADAKTTSNRLRPAAGPDRAESAILRPQASRRSDALTAAATEMAMVRTKSTTRAPIRRKGARRAPSATGTSMEAPTSGSQEPAPRNVASHGSARRAPNRSSKSAEGSGPDWRVVGAEFGRKLVSRVDLQFAEDAREVTLDCARRNEKGLCDFAVGEALAGELGDAALAGGE